MHKNHGCGCGGCCGSSCEERVEPFVTDDGRKAEKHFKCCDGQQVVEIYAEEHRPLHLEKRIVQETDEIVVKEIHEEIMDGHITKQDVYALDPVTEMEHRQSLGTTPHDSVFKGQYVKQEDMKQTIAALMADKEMSAQSMNLKAQSVLEKHVNENKGGGMMNVVLVGVLLAQLAFFGYAFFLM